MEFIYYFNEIIQEINNCFFQINMTKKENIDEPLLEKKEDEKKVKKPSISIWRLICHLSSKREVFLMFLGTIGSIVSAISGPIMSYNFGGAINNFSDIQNIKDFDENSEKIKTFTDNINMTIKRYLILGAILFVSNFLQAFGWQYSAFLQIHKLKENYFLVIMKQEQEYFDNNNSFELVTKVQTQLQQIELGLGDKFGFVIQKIFNVIAGAAISFLVSWKLSLIVLTVAPLTLFCIFYFTSVLKKASRTSKKAYQNAGGIAEEMLYNIQTIYSFVNLDFEMERFNKNIDKVFKCDKDKAFKAGLSQSIMGLSIYISFTVAIFFGKRIIIANKRNNIENGLKIGDILVVILSMSTAVWSFRSLAPNLKIIIDAATSSSDYFILLDRVPKIYVSLFPIIKNNNEIEGKIEFRNVNFFYDKKKVLDNFSLKVDPGKKVALMGESGCGKSTVVNLLERIYELDYEKENKDKKDDLEINIIKEREYEEKINNINLLSNNSNDSNSGIFLDGDNIKDYNLEFYRSLIGYVQQEPVLFNKSVRDNIIFGREENIKKLNLNIDTLIKEACDLANVSEFVNKLEGGLNYKVGIQGNKLSGGQKQRIAIARAVLLKPKIIILDEATSALDYKNELDVQKALDNLKLKKITTFVISHRLNTIINSDIIHFMKGGKIVEKGNHRELFEKKGLYKAFIQNQVDENGNLLVLEDDLQEKIFEKNLNRSRHLGIYTKSYKEKEKIKTFSIRKLFKIVEKRKYLIRLGIVSSILLGITITLSGYFYGFTINALSQENIDDLNNGTNFWGTLYSVDTLFIEIFLFLKLYCLEVISSFLTSNLRKMILKKYMELNLSFFDEIENSPGALLSKLSIDTVQLNSVFQMIIGDLFHSFGSLSSGLILSIYYDWRLTAISFCFIPFIIISNLLVAKTKRSGRKSYKKKNIEAGGILSESVLNTKTIFSFNFQKESVKLYMECLNSETKTFLRDSIMLGILLGFGVFCSFANHSALFYFSKKFFLNRTLDYKTMNITIQILNLMTAGISNGIRGIFDIKIAKSSFESIFKLLKTKNKIDHTKNGNKGKISPNKIKGKIEFQNVFFKYPVNLDDKDKKNQNNLDMMIDKKKYILKNISFTIEPGQKVALVGFSGCGKSTIIKLLERFYDPTKGNILIDGIGIQDYNLYELRKKIGLVSQEPILFKRSIYENIKYGRLDAGQIDVIQAAEDASIEHLFSKENINNNINNEANIKDLKSKVSGGEKQRISIARAFLKDPKILLLDEPTSALDRKTEIEVMQNLDRLMKGRTTFIVAHRLDTITDADIILVFENGRLIQKGTHSGLMKVEGEYKRLYSLN